LDYAILRKRMEIISKTIEQLGGEVLEVFIDQPASVERINEIEITLGYELPKSFKKVLLEFSSHFSLKWFFHDDMERPYEFREIFSGRFHWNLNLLSQMEKDKEYWIDSVYPDEEDEADRVWHNKLAFCDVGNGDYLAFDLSDMEDASIVYLNHEKGLGHGYIIADNFLELLENWSRIAFVGEEDAQWLPFTEDKESGIVPEGETAKRFREWLNLNI